MKTLRLAFIFGLLSIPTLGFTATDNQGFVQMNIICEWSLHRSNPCVNYSFQTNEKFFSPMTVPLKMEIEKNRSGQEIEVYKASALVKSISEGIPAFNPADPELHMCGMMVSKDSNEAVPCTVDTKGMRWNVSKGTPTVNVLMDPDDRNRNLEPACMCISMD